MGVLSAMLGQCAAAFSTHEKNKNNFIMFKITRAKQIQLKGVFIAVQ